MKNRLAIPVAALCIGAVASSLLAPVQARATNPPPPPGCCPSENNACNNTDGCDSSLQDLGFWTHWIGMRRGDTACNTEWLPCKDRYSEVTVNGNCTKGDFVRSFEELGCTHS